MDELKTPMPARTADVWSDYGPYHIELNPTKDSYILAQARLAQAQCWREIGRRLIFAVSHAAHRALLDTGRFLHTHNVLRGGLH